ncbi:MAG: phosphatase PAP2-related protein [Flavobacteriales bacterium]
MERTTARTWTWIGTLLCGVLLVSFLPSFFRFIEVRPGFRPDDPVLAWISPVDVAIPLFVVLYSTVVLCLVLLARDRSLLLRGLQAYLILLLLRMVAMTLLTLEPPMDMIPLRDPITQVFYPDAEPFAKDLFFSGHTATMFLLFLAVPVRRWRWPLLLATIFVAAAVILQHVHWTIDVLAAPVGAWMAWWASGYTVRWARSKVSLGEEGA